MAPSAFMKHSGIDPMDLSKKPMLENMQGNILKGHGRDHTTHIFLRFDKGRQPAVKKFLKTFAAENLTSCYSQLWERERYKRNQTPGGMFANILISHAGLLYLDEAKYAKILPDEAFTKGMKARQEILNDPLKEKLELPYRQNAHAMLLLADDDTTRMSKAAKELLEKLEKFAHIITVEYGHAIRNANGDGIEHNGYVDGISQPLFFKDEIDFYAKFHSVPLQKLQFDPSADPSLVLINDPLVPDLKDCYGSYFVFRKLEQDVRGFKKAEEKIGEKLFDDEKDKEKREVAGAFLVGRFEDGTPIALSETDKLIGSGNFNNFNYDDANTADRKCPYFAHTRKTNPRTTDSNGTAITAKPVMARRGITYGRREIDTALEATHHQFPEGGVGLLFMSFQASLADQFEEIQKGMFSIPLDPLLGITKATSFDFPNPWGSAIPRPAKFDQFITMNGGEYFYAPSIPFFESLGDTV